MMMPKIAVSHLVTLCLLLAAPIAAQETTPAVELEARALFTSIMSPYCPGSLLNECPSSQAAVLREEIRARLLAGDTREQIEADLIVTYGEGILASPPFSGFGVLSWLGAVAIFLGGLGAASSWLRRRRQAAPREPTIHGDDTDLQQRMRDEINSDDEI
ncbi:MAG: cytochrome c-type biogenesis protein CcmH [Gemmatimonadetes bacterium]|jgi:cytochrome c-type biogenesis protein CcmH|nr:cytochrome c-type biogenesis protein CcmH [Gemmatimonadota bacterium]MBT5060117.1 cytochrome c-type biogenesis protein CcmH [Gemmatimonadota bacterium]MBT5144216.1 cytochrome c-type biogenesis protein CcmH [Gemmatimonadota bacterium]MBT5588758.1 cytochrome c-type biogenesis protein CcmH [Gemmatimonadota bacterium]MBT5964524.1 cytochrome c-type biogenesis protein CcmH [Gemmatimonadota bacterium]